MKTYKFLLFFTLYSVVAGCGQPGALYLPNKAPPAQVQPEPKPGPEKNK